LLKHYPELRKIADPLPEETLELPLSS